jgi:hypothetical protein
MRRRRKQLTPEEAEKNATRNAIVLVALVVVVAAYSMAFGLQTLIWFETHHWTRANPWIKDVPQPLNSASVPGGSTQLKAYDYQFKVPWPGKYSNSTPDLLSQQFRFDSGQIIIFFDPQAQADMLRTLTSASNPLEYQQFQNVFVGQSFNSNYELYKAVYDAAPADVWPFTSMRDAIRVNQLLLWKVSFGLDAPPPLHSIEFGSNRGIEFGDPSTGRPVALRIFDGRDVQFRLIFMAASGTSARIAQADIDSAVQSLEPVPIVER